jgi:hypothetical protein
MANAIAAAINVFFISSSLKSLVFKCPQYRGQYPYRKLDASAAKLLKLLDFDVAAQHAARVGRAVMSQRCDTAVATAGLAPEGKAGAQRGNVDVTAL